MMKKSPDPIADSKYIHKLNTIRILNLVRSSEPISRAELVKDCGLSAPTVSRIVESLIEDGLAHANDVYNLEHNCVPLDHKSSLPLTVAHA
jgi:DNA-binding IclR family transcriptional regulator